MPRTGSGSSRSPATAAAPGQAEELLATIKRFFDLPLEERMKLDNRLSPHFRGYTRMGTEVTQGRADAREQIDYSPDREPVTDYPRRAAVLAAPGPQPVAG